MKGALASGVLLFLFGALVVERLVQRRNARRWSVAATAASRDLGDLLDDVLQRLWLAHSAADPQDGPNTAWTTATRARTHDRGVLASELFVKDLPAPDYEGLALPSQERIEQLLLDPDYVAAARDLVETERDRLRAGTKQWAGLMMWAQDSQQLLDVLGTFTELHLSQLAHGLYCRPETWARKRQDIAREWVLADVKGRVLLNELWGRSTSYRFVLPELAEHTSLTSAFRHPDAVGAWRPPPQEPMYAHARGARRVRDARSKLQAELTSLAGWWRRTRRAVVPVAARTLAAWLRAARRLDQRALRRLRAWRKATRT